MWGRYINFTRIIQGKGMIVRARQDTQCGGLLSSLKYAGMGRVLCVALFTPEKRRWNVTEGEREHAPRCLQRKSRCCYSCTALSARSARSCRQACQAWPNHPSGYVRRRCRLIDGRKKRREKRKREKENGIKGIK